MPASAVHPAPKRGHLFLAGALCLASWILGSVSSWSPDLVHGYPFFGGDGYDYLCNALRYLGYEVPYSVRPPLLPLLAAGLEHAATWDLLPSVLLALHHLSAFFLFRLMAERASGTVALALLFTFLASDAALFFAISIDGLSLGSSLLFLAFTAFVCGRPGLAGVLASLSFASHQLALLFPGAVFLALLLARSETDRGPQLARLTAGFLPGLVAYWTLRQVALGTVGDGSIRHWSLLKPHLDGIFTYVVFVVSAVGLPLVVLAAFGVWKISSRGERPLGDMMLVVLPTAVFAFFSLAYDYSAPRFTAYLLPYVFLLATHAFSSWTGNRENRVGTQEPTRPIRLVPTAVLVLATLTAVLPTGLGRNIRATVWALPGLGLSLPLQSAEGSLTAEPKGTHFHVLEFKARHIASRLGAMRKRNRPEPPRTGWPNQLTSSMPALYLYEGPRPELYARQTRLSAAYRTTVRVAPMSLWRALAPADRLTGIGKDRGRFLHRLDSPALGEPWLLLAERQLTLSFAVGLAETWIKTPRAPLAVLGALPHEIPPTTIFSAPAETLFLLGDERLGILQMLHDEGCGLETAASPTEQDRNLPLLSECRIRGRQWTIADFSGSQ